MPTGSHWSSSTPTPRPNSSYPAWGSPAEPPHWPQWSPGCRAFLQSYATEAGLSARGTAPRLDAYLGWRMYSVGMPWLWDPDELRLPVFLPDSVRTCGPMYRLRRAGAVHIALVQRVNGGSCTEPSTSSVSRTP
ncbi:terpene synthase family protein [Streptomyces coeruleorubidus]|uniref:terpene synthase family protein n=1 Tax=Streptomyces coeruleorubidus TaxID=116188 RepID=UPI00378A2E61